MALERALSLLSSHVFGLGSLNPSGCVPWIEPEVKANVGFCAMSPVENLQTGILFMARQEGFNASGLNIVL